MSMIVRPCSSLHTNNPARKRGIKPHGTSRYTLTIDLLLCSFVSSNLTSLRQTGPSVFEALVVESCMRLCIYTRKNAFAERAEPKEVDRYRH